MTPVRSKSAELAKKAQAAPTLLVVAQPSPETDDLLEPLVRRVDLCLLRVASLNAAEVALRDVAVRLVLVCPETEAAEVTAILDKTDELRPGTPVPGAAPEKRRAPACLEGTDGWSLALSDVARCLEPHRRRCSGARGSANERLKSAAADYWHETCVACPQETAQMKVNVRQAARLLSVSENEIYRWVDSASSPASW